MVYALVAIANLAGRINIQNNIVVALSSAALLLSFSDAFFKLAMILETNNIMQCELLVSITFLEEKSKNGVTTPMFIVDNAIGNFKIVKGYNPHYKFVNPAVFESTRWYKIMNTIATVLFVSGVATFIFIPFFYGNTLKEIEITSMSVFAFSAMMLCMFLDDVINDLQQTINRIQNDKQTIIQAAFPEFYSYRIDFYGYKSQKKQE